MGAREGEGEGGKNMWYVMSDVWRIERIHEDVCGGEGRDVIGGLAFCVLYTVGNDPGHAV